MNGVTGEPTTLSDLVRSEQLGLDVNRLLFAKFLVMTRRVSDGNPELENEPDLGLPMGVPVEDIE